MEHYVTLECIVTLGCLSKPKALRQVVKQE
nr:MAG TPA: hypothetical protein [Caudoviricetes sp.]